jgi:uncharacterized membrane protein YphA (DoxX/SURF4 family)
MIKARQVPTRLATGGYILHTGLEKWGGGDEQAAALHGLASGAYPFLKAIPPRRFLRLLSIAEISVGAALLAPFVPTALAAAGLTAFSGSLVVLYLRTPPLHKPNSIWPTPAGIAVSKDVWMLGIGLGLLADEAAGRSSGR